MARHNTNRGKKEGALVRRLQAYDLRIQGKTYREIGQVTGVSEVQAYHDVTARTKELAALEADKVNEVRQWEVDRLDRMLTKLDPAVEAGDARSIEVALKIQARRAALLGLDAPEKREVTGANGGPVLVEWGTATGTLPPGEE